MSAYQIRRGYQLYRQPPVIDDSWRSRFVLNEQGDIIGTGHQWVVVNGEVVGEIVGPIETISCKNGFSAFFGTWENLRWLGEFFTKKAAAMAVVNECSQR